MSEAPEVWLRGPIAGVPPQLMPAAHAFLQVREELPQLVSGLRDEQLWAAPPGVASLAFHLRHIAGATERLLTYAAGRALSEEQAALARAEGAPRQQGETAAGLVQNAAAALDAAVERLRQTPPEGLLEPRGVGRRQLPSTVLGLLFHAAEHAQRHCGQAATTARLLRAARS